MEEDSTAQVNSDQTENTAADPVEAQPTDDLSEKDVSDEKQPESEDTDIAFSHTHLEAPSAPPLQLLNNESDCSGEVAEVPEQQLDECATETPVDETNEQSISVNIEDQLKEFDGSDEEGLENKEENPEPIDNLVDALCDSESSKMGNEVTATPESAKIHSDVEDDTSRNTNSHKDSFEEVDMSQIEKEKATASEENDVLSDDRTQATCSEAKDVDHTDDEGTEARTDSRMETDQHEHSDHHEDDDHSHEAGDHSHFEHEEDVTTESNQAGETFESVEHLDHEDDSTKHDDDGTEERITPNNDDDDVEDNDEQNANNKNTEEAPENAEETELEEQQKDEGKTSETPSDESTIIRDSAITIVAEESTEVADGHVENMDTSGEGERNFDEAKQTSEANMDVDQNQSASRQDEAEDNENGKMDEENGSESHENRAKTSTRTGKRLSTENVVESFKVATLHRIRKKTKQSDDSTEKATPETNQTNSKTPVTEVEVEEIDAPEQADSQALKELQIKELLEDLPEEKCSRCRKVRTCQYKYMRDGETKFLCSLKCVNGFRVTSKETFHLIARKIPISLVFDMQQVCYACKSRKNCRYRLKRPENESETIYLCEPKCYDAFVGVNVEKFFKRRKVYLVQEVTNDMTEAEEKCTHCHITKKCLYSLRDEENVMHFICDDACFNILEKEEENRLKLKRRSVRVRDLGTPSDTSAQLVTQVAQPQPTSPEPRNITRTEEEAEQARFEREASLVRRCGSCLMIISATRNLLEWETLPFCNDVCLEKYQNLIGSNCTNCNSLVSSTSLGKYCVRFGFEVRQFCSSHCLDTYKKKNLKECAHCQKDTSHDKDGFLAPVGDKSQFKDFCSKACVKKYEDLLNPRKKQNTGNCAVCNLDKLVRVDLNLDERDFEFCSNPCFSAFKFVNNIQPDQCALCLKYFERKSSNAFTLFEDNAPKMFCSRICLTVFISVNRKIVSCQWCKVKKYNFDMIMRHNAGVTTTLCSTTCLRKYLGPGSINAGNTALVVRLQKICDQCHTNCNPTFSLSMSDSTSRNFCTQQCVIDFQALHKRGVNDVKNLGVKNKQAPYPIGLPKKLQPKTDKSFVRPVQLGQHPPSQSPQINTVAQIQVAQPSIPVMTPLAISPPPLPVPNLQIDTTSVDSSTPLLKRRGRPPKKHMDATTSSFDDINMSLPASDVSPQAVRPIKKRSFGTNTIETGAPKAQIITVPPPQPEMVNKQTMCKPSAVALAMQARRPTCTVELQTDDALERKYFVPIPVPIYVPQPMHMYSAPFPVPVPIPLPIPVPIFIPTTRNTAAGIMKEIKKIQDKMPADPFEAELLMMAELVADEKRNESDSEPEEAVEDSVVEYAPEGDDIFQMDLNISQTGYEEQPNVDIETTMPANAIQQVATTMENVNDYMSQQQQMMMMDPQRRLMGTVNTPRKRPASPPVARGRLSTTPPQKRHRVQPAPQQQQHVSPAAEVMRTTTEPAERPDANMCLKYTFGVNAWRQWVMNKNADIEKSSIRRKSFKTELLQLTADELNYSLCLFVKEVRKPNGSEYAPDTIYYLVLGIQQYLYENGRIDNIFTDPYYERFTDCLDEVARKFSILYNDSQYIVTRVEEEHLWECKQLGAHSPHVLLSTLMFFNTKHFNLTTVDEHMQLSFSHIMKHWKRNTAGKQTQSTRNVLLRFYPPQTTPDNPRKKKVYEQQENESNPLRCPVKLYEFYLSKCPESVKTRSDVFYLQPERSCVPDSPVWYSTQALSREALNKMLNRVKMVKEINVALLSSQ